MHNLLPNLHPPLFFVYINILECLGYLKEWLTVNVKYDRGRVEIYQWFTDIPGEKVNALTSSLVEKINIANSKFDVVCGSAILEEAIRKYCSSM